MLQCIEIVGLKDYTTTAYGNVNKVLRDNEVDRASGTTRSIIDEMTTLSTELQEPQRLFRGVKYSLHHPTRKCRRGP